MRTQAISAQPQADPNRTQAISGLSGAPSGESLTIRIIPSREVTLANGPAREQFLIEILAGTNGTPGIGGTRTPLNLCLVIDRSGSMEGPPLDYVKQACAHVVDLLSPEDILSIVTFEETVEVLMAPQRVTNRQPIKDGIAQLQPGNTTNLYDGLHLAAMQVQQAASPGRTSRMIVLSDGDPTAGIKDFATLVQKSAEIKGQGITITFLGFGPDYNEELLASMAKKSGGNYYYIAQPHLIPEVFRTELEKLLTITGRNLNLEFKLARWVKLRAATGLTQLPNGSEFNLPLADIERGSLIHQMVDLEFPNHPLGWYRVASGTLTYEDAAMGAQNSVPIDLIMEFSSDAARYSLPANPAVTRAADLALASRQVEKTIMGLKTGQITQMAAVQELQKTQALLTAEGRMAEAREVTLALNALQHGDQSGAEKTLIGTVLNLDQGKKGP